MTCEEIRPLLPDLADGSPRPIGPVELHLAECAGCRRELARYRSVFLEMASLRDVVVEPPEGLLDRLLNGSPGLVRPSIVRRVVSNERVQYAAISLGGAVVGASAIGLLWWRARRAGSPVAGGVGL